MLEPRNHRALRLSSWKPGHGPIVGSRSIMGNSIEPVLPAYDAGCVTNIVPALLSAVHETWMPEAVRGARCVVLLVLDGLGADILRERAYELPTLSGLGGGSITTVLPATTSAALTSITTGTAPARHGIVGYRTFLDERVLNVLRWQFEGERTKPPIPIEVQRQSAFRGRAIPVTTKSEFRNSGFSNVHLGAGPFHGWKTTSALVEHCRRLSVESDASLIYAYYPGVDEIAHEFGLHDGYFDAELRAVDQLVQRLLAALPHDCALLVTADHGQMHIEADNWIDTMEIAPLLRNQSGDARFRHLHSRAGAAKELLGECERRYSDVAWIKSRKSLLADGWLGPDAPGLSAAGARVGDVVLVPYAPIGFIDPALPNERRLRSAHGAATAAEMMVPLRAGRGQATNPG